MHANFLFQLTSQVGGFAKRSAQVQYNCNTSFFLQLLHASSLPISQRMTVRTECFCLFPKLQQQRCIARSTQVQYNRNTRIFLYCSCIALVRTALRHISGINAGSHNVIMAIWFQRSVVMPGTVRRAPPSYVRYRRRTTKPTTITTPNSGNNSADQIEQTAERSCVRRSVRSWTRRRQ